MDKSLHVTGILIYRHQRNSTEILLVNDSFNHKRHWTGPKGRVIGDEDESKAALRETLEITGLSVKDLKVEDSFRAEIKYLSGTRPKRVVYYLAELIDSAKVLPTGEGVQFAWCNLQLATEKALYKTMQDVLRSAFTAAEASRARALAAAPPKMHRNHSNSGDNLESNMKNLNIALPLDSQRQAITRDYNNRNSGGQNRDRDQNRDGNPSGGRYNNNNNNGGNPHADNPNYKTRLCERFEAEQFCPYYAKCTFAHGAAELRQRPPGTEQQDKPMSAVQASYQNRAKREVVENEFHKTRLCERFMSEGECPFGPRCTYAHGKDDLRQRAGYQANNSNNNNNNNSNSNNTGNYGQNRGYSRDGQSGERPYRPNNEGFQDRNNRTQQYSGDNSEDRPYRANRPEGSYRSSFADRENRDGPYRPPHAADQERLQRPQGDPTNTTGVYRAPQARGLSSQTTEDGLNRSVLAPRATISSPSAAPVATSAVTPATTSSKGSTPVGTPVLGSDKATTKARRGQEVDNKPRTKIVELSSEDMEKFQIRRPETPVATKPDSKQAQRDQYIQDLQKFFQNNQQPEGTNDKKQQQQQLQDEIKEVTRIEMRGLTKAQLYFILIASLFSETSVETWKKVLNEKAKLMANFVRSPEDQMTLMRAWEQLFVKHRPNMMARAPFVMKGLYNTELVEEDVFLAWYNEDSLDPELKKKCSVFVEWLHSAEEE